MITALRPATNEDQREIIDLITGVYHEYGESMCLQGADKDLLDIEANYAGQGGAFVVFEDAGHIAASHATLPVDLSQGLITFRRLYMKLDLRGTGTGIDLMAWALNWAIEHQFKRVEFWSDTRFHRAHRFFTKFGFERGGTRTMTDAFEPYDEHHFSLDLPGQCVDWAARINDETQ